MSDRGVSTPSLIDALLAEMAEMTAEQTAEEHISRKGGRDHEWDDVGGGRSLALLHDRFFAIQMELASNTPSGTGEAATNGGTG